MSDIQKDNKGEPSKEDYNISTENTQGQSENSTLKLKPASPQSSEGQAAGTPKVKRLSTLKTNDAPKQGKAVLLKASSSKTEKLPKKMSLTQKLKIGKLNDLDKTGSQADSEDTETSRIILQAGGKKQTKKLLTKASDSSVQRKVLTKLTTKSSETANTAISKKIKLKNTGTNTLSGTDGRLFNNFNNVDPDAKKILIVDDEISILKVLSHIFRKQGYAPFTCTSGEQALEFMKDHQFDLLITDLRLRTQMDGLDLLREAKQKHPDVPVVIITGYASVKIAIQALKQGAFDLVTKPFKMDQLAEVVENALSHSGRYSIEQMANKDLKLHFGLIVGEDDKMKNIYTLVKRISKTDATILIQGEEGTEAEQFGQIIHHCSRRNEKPFIKLSGKLLAQQHVNASLISRMAIQAHTGTLFIQDINLIDDNAQRTLLQLLTTKKAIINPQTGEEVAIDIRLISSTTQPLKELITSDSFSKDLYYRMCAFTLDLPPLRHRVEDIPLFITYFCYRYNDENSRDIHFSDKAMNIMLNYAWPGNVAELEDETLNAIETSKEELVDVDSISEKVRTRSGKQAVDKQSVVGKAARKYLQQQVISKSKSETVSIKIKQN